MAWYLNRALTGFRNAVNAAYPRRDKASDGTIGDSAHQAGTSDHNPDKDNSVDAWDMDVDLRSQNNAAAIARLKQVFQAHESSRYWIHNRKIASRSEGWRVRDYDGDNPHDKHIHWNTRESHEDSTKPWHVEGDDMALDTNDVNAVATATAAKIFGGGMGSQGSQGTFHNYLIAWRTGEEARDAALKALLDTNDNVDTSAVIAKVEAVRTELADLVKSVDEEVADRLQNGSVDELAALLMQLPEDRRAELKSRI
jgi:hypothetical protein